ncbi:MAG: ABC transporter permease subunit [Propionibacteriaceae bacterium]
MIRLIGAELHRLRARRMTMVTAIVLVLGLGLFQVAVNFAVAPPSAAAVAENQRYYQDAVKDWEANHVQYETECQQSGGSVQDCVSPKPSAEDYGLVPTPFADIAGIGVLLSTYLALLAAYLVGASFIGAEYGTGALANWLTFVPERLRVLGSKLVAIAVAGAICGVVAGALTLGVAAMITDLHGGALTGIGRLIETAGRGVVLVVVGAVIGFCLAMLTRHTVAAIGFVLAVLLVSYVIVLLGFVVPVFAQAPPWLPGNNLTAFLQHGSTFQVPVTAVTADGSSTDFVDKTITFTHSAVYWAVVTAVVLAGAALVFRRRDVT